MHNCTCTYNNSFVVIALQAKRIDDQRCELPVPLRHSWCVPSLVIGKIEDNQETEEVCLKVKYMYNPDMQVLLFTWSFLGEV